MTRSRQYDPIIIFRGIKGDARARATEIQSISRTASTESWTEIRIRGSDRVVTLQQTDEDYRAAADQWLATWRESDPIIAFDTDDPERTVRVLASAITCLSRMPDGVATEYSTHVSVTTVGVTTILMGERAVGIPQSNRQYSAALERWLAWQGLFADEQGKITQEPR